METVFSEIFEEEPTRSDIVAASPLSYEAAEYPVTRVGFFDEMDDAAVLLICSAE